MEKLTDGGSALILTGGGNRGAIQAGALLALFERGYRPDLVVGVSVGAINGAMLSFYPTVDGVYRVLDTWREIDGTHLFGSRSLAWRGLVAFLFRRSAAFSSRGLRELLVEKLPSRRFGDTVVPFLVATTNLETGAAVRITEGDIVQAVLASAAVPLHLPPVEVAGQLLVDGAIADPVPIDAAVAAGASHVVVIEPGHACDCPKVYDNAVSIFSQSVAIMGRRRLSSAVEAAHGQVDIVHLGLTCHSDVPMTDLSQTSEMIDSGYREASLWLGSHGPVWAKAALT